MAFDSIAASVIAVCSMLIRNSHTSRFVDAGFLRHGEEARGIAAESIWFELALHTAKSGSHFSKTPASHSELPRILAKL
jgi:hypothetical protein